MLIALRLCARCGGWFICVWCFLFGFAGSDSTPVGFCTVLVCLVLLFLLIGCVLFNSVAWFGFFVVVYLGLRWFDICWFAACVVGLQMATVICLLWFVVVVGWWIWL